MQLCRYLSVAAREPRQPHPGHVEEPNLPVVVGKGDDPLANTHTDPAERGQREAVWETMSLANRN